MCDDFTREADDAALARGGLSRRQFAAAGASALVAGCAGGSAVGGGSAADLAERPVAIQTTDGMADGFFVAPAKGRHPGVILWPDIGGLRDTYKVMARRLAGEGYAVLAVNQYYRSAPAPVLTSFAEWRTPEGRAKLEPMIRLVTPAAIVADAKAYVAFLDSEASVNKRRGIGTQGYCMGGPFTVRTADAAPGRVRAAASFHGAAMATDAPDSPHRLLAGTRAEYLIAIARNDDSRAPADKDTLKAAGQAAKRSAEIEVYPADHGWCVPDSPVYDREQAERAWGRLLALYARL